MHLPWDGPEACLTHYQLGPLLFASELELPELDPVTPGTLPPTVIIRLGRAPERLVTPLAAMPFWEASATEFLLRIPGVGRYYVRDGVEVIVDAAPDAPVVDLRSYLLSSVFAVVYHQRGLLALHASAIGTPRGAVAFAGNSGAGKSSLAAFLERRGHPVLADDLCLIDPQAPLSRRVLPLTPWLKLWRTTLDALGQSPEGLPRIFFDEDKYRVRLRTVQPPAALDQIILIDQVEGAAPATTAHFERLAPVQAVSAVLSLTYQFRMIQATGQMEGAFLRCGQALQGVRVYRMHRPWGFEAMEPTLAALEAHLDAAAS